MKSISLTILVLLLVTSSNLAQRKIDLSSDKTTYYTGEEIQLKFKTDEPLGEQGWIGIFKADVAHGSTRGYITYHYIRKNTSTSFKFNSPIEPGQYEFRVIDDEGGKELLSVPFAVISINPGDISVDVITKSIKPAQPFEIGFKSELDLNSKAWLGIFSAQVDENDHRTYDSYKYVKYQKGDVLEMTAPAEIGDYELRFYSSDPGALVKRVPFRIGELNLEGISFSLNKKTFDPAEEIVVSYQGHPDLSTHSWVGIFSAEVEQNNARIYIDYRYLRPKAGGVVSFRAPENKGKYDIRMFYTDQGPQLLSPIVFEVTSSIDKDYIKKSLDSSGKVILYGIYFDTDKSVIKASSYPLIVQIAATLKADPNLKVRVEGYTDGQGDEEYNQTLSDNRAAAVKVLLINDYGIPAEQLESKGYGESKPVGDNNTSSGRAKNRRVELVKVES